MNLINLVLFICPFFNAILNIIFVKHVIGILILMLLLFQTYVMNKVVVM